MPSRESESPFVYEEVFSLILSLVQQLQEDSRSGVPPREKVADYFQRLTKWALGEYEFARRLAFEGIDCTRLAPYKGLMSYYRQKPPEDFIFYYGGTRACVDVKYYDSSRMLSRIEIPERYVRDVVDFKNRFHLDKAFLAMKRFERWYVLSAERIAGLARERDHFMIDIEWARQNHEVLRENHCIFNLGITKRLFFGEKATADILFPDRQGNILAVRPPERATKNGIQYESIAFDDALQTGSCSQKMSQRKNHSPERVSRCPILDIQEYEDAT
jgi:hypothetical protein